MMSRSLFDPIQDVAGIVPNPVMVTILTKVANALPPLSSSNGAEQG